MGDANEDGRFEDPFEIEEDLSVSISVPLVLRDEVLGVLNLSLTSEAPKDSLSDYELRMAAIFAQYAASAIENARLRLAASILDPATIAPV